MSSSTRSRFKAAIIALSVLLAACGADGAATTTEGAGDDALQVAFLPYGQTNDGSFNQFGLEGVQRLEDEGLITFDMREDMEDPAVSEPVVREFSTRGYDLILGHGIYLGDSIKVVAAEFPEVNFTMSGGFEILDEATDNIETWTYDFIQWGYLSGYVVSQIEGIEVVGIVGGPQLPFIEEVHEGFKAALAEFAPDIKWIERYTGDFSDVQAAAEATTGLIGEGAQLVFTSGDGVGNGVAAAAAQAGVLTVGVSGSAGGQAEKVNVASVELDMYPAQRAWTDRVNSGEFGNASYILDIASKGLVITPVNQIDERVPANLAELVQEFAADFTPGSVGGPEKIIPKADGQ